MVTCAHLYCAHPGTGGTLAAGPILRGLGLFAVANSLVERLRGVFVPYFRHLLDLCINYLTGKSYVLTCLAARSSTPSCRSVARPRLSHKPQCCLCADASSKPPTAKKRRKSASADSAAGTAAVSTGSDTVEHWRLRLRVVRALHRAFLYDAPPGSEGRLLDEASFERLLPPLVAQLSLQPPAGRTADALVNESVTSPALGTPAQSQALQPDGVLSTGKFGHALVACLAQMAVTASSDVQSKVLNHQLLMTTRSIEPRTRLVALQGVAAVATRLAEEYLVLLPETIPFLAELLEDSEHAVEAEAAALLRQLEELSGEPLVDYLK